MAHIIKYFWLDKIEVGKILKHIMILLSFLYRQVFIGAFISACFISHIALGYGFRSQSVDLSAPCHFLYRLFLNKYMISSVAAEKVLTYTRSLACHQQGWVLSECISSNMVSLVLAALGVQCSTYPLNCYAELLVGKVGKVGSNSFWPRWNVCMCLEVLNPLAVERRVFAGIKN